MNALGRLLLGIWDFVVGDDWLTAVGVIAALGVTALVAGAHAVAWWITPVVVLALLTLGVRRAAGAKQS